MWFKRNKKKLDAKVRFQQRQFTSKLNSARSYRRPARVVADSTWDNILIRIGLGSRLRQGFALVLVIGLVYLFYIPNFLSVQSFVISGLSQEVSAKLEQAIQNEINQKPFYWPAYNLLVFNRGLVEKAVESVPEVYRIGAMKKQFGLQQVQILAEQKYNKFLLLAGNKVYDIYNTGEFSQQSNLSEADWLTYPGDTMLKIKLPKEIEVSQYQLIFHPSLQNYLISLIEELPNLETQELAYFTFPEPNKANPPIIEQQAEQLLPTEAEQENPEVIDVASLEPPQPDKMSLPFNSSELHVVFYKNSEKNNTYRAIFDTMRSPRESLQQLELLLSQTNPERYAKLSYIDLRLGEKAFVCLEGTACARR